MSDKEKSIAKALAEAAKVLPDEKKEFLLGYAEGVAAMVGAPGVPAKSSPGPAAKSGA